MQITQRSAAASQRVVKSDSRSVRPDDSGKIDQCPFYAGGWHGGNQDGVRIIARTTAVGHRSADASPCLRRYLDDAVVYALEFPELSRCPMTRQRRVATRQNGGHDPLVPRRREASRRIDTGMKGYPLPRGQPASYGTVPEPGTEGLLTTEDPVLPHGELLAGEIAFQEPAVYHVGTTMGEPEISQKRTKSVRY